MSAACFVRDLSSDTPSWVNLTRAVSVRVRPSNRLGEEDRWVVLAVFVKWSTVIGKFDSMDEAERFAGAVLVRVNGEAA